MSAPPKSTRESTSFALQNENARFGWRLMRLPVQMRAGEVTRHEGIFCLVAGTRDSIARAKGLTCALNPLACRVAAPGFAGRDTRARHHV